MNADSYVDLKPNPKIPDFRSGDAVRVHARVVEGDRERIQVFEGVVIRIRRGGVNSSFTVRRITHGIGVERVFPYYSPLVEKVEVSRVGRVRRARLYYLRDRVGKAARIKPGSRARFEALTAPRAQFPNRSPKKNTWKRKRFWPKESGRGARSAEESVEGAMEAEGADEEAVVEERVRLRSRGPLKKQRKRLGTRRLKSRPQTKPPLTQSRKPRPNHPPKKPSPTRPKKKLPPNLAKPKS